MIEKNKQVSDHFAEAVVEMRAYGCGHSYPSADGSIWAKPICSLLVSAWVSVSLSVVFFSLHSSSNSF